MIESAWEPNFEQLLNWTLIQKDWQKGLRKKHKIIKKESSVVFNKSCILIYNRNIEERTALKWTLRLYKSSILS